MDSVLLIERTVLGATAHPQKKKDRRISAVVRNSRLTKKRRMDTLQEKLYLNCHLEGGETVATVECSKDF